MSKHDLCPPPPVTNSHTFLDPPSPWITLWTAPYHYFLHFYHIFTVPYETGSDKKPGTNISYQSQKKRNNPLRWVTTISF